MPGRARDSTGMIRAMSAGSAVAMVHRFAHLVKIIFGATAGGAPETQSFLLAAICGIPSAADKRLACIGHPQKAGSKGNTVLLPAWKRKLLMVLSKVPKTSWVHGFSGFRGGKLLLPCNFDASVASADKLAPACYLYTNISERCGMCPWPIPPFPMRLAILVRALELLLHLGPPLANFLETLHCQLVASPVVF